MASNPQPRLTKAYEEKEAELTETFRKNVRRIATRLAHHESGNTTVDLKHADAAFDCLNRFGLSQQPWHSSPTFEVTLAGASLGAALAAPDVLPLLVPAEYADTATTIVFCVAAVLSTILYVHGWTRFRKP